MTLRVTIGRPPPACVVAATLLTIIFTAPGLAMAVEGPLFAAPFMSFDTGVYPFSVALGDLDGDGRPDLVVANDFENSVSVLLGNGDGTYRLKIDYSTGLNPRSVAIADLNGDVKPDLVVANWGAQSVSVLMGDGDGMFATRRDFNVMNNPNSVAIGDLNADGWPDLAVANEGSHTVSVLRGNGDGTFLPNGFCATGTLPTSVAMGDLNQDGKLDLAVTNNYQQDNTVSVILGNGDATFLPHARYATGLRPYSVAIADVNGDGLLDLAVANSSDHTIAVLLGNGDGTLRPRTDFPTGLYPSSIALGDLNGDGKQDLASVGSTEPTVSVLLGNGDGVFESRTDFVTAGRGGNVPSVVIGDVNDDGKLDLVAANGYNSVSVLLGNGDGSFGVRLGFGTVTSSAAAAIGDLNRDGVSDVVFLDHATPNGSVSVLIGSGEGNFEAQRDFVTGSYPLSVAIGDFNADGNPDLVVANSGSHTVSVLLGNGNGTFGARSDFATGLDPASVAVADLNGDGRLDVAVANTGVSRSVSVLLGTGDGSLGAKTDYPTGSNPDVVAIADLNADGIPDLAVTLHTANVVSIFLGNGDGTFGGKRDCGTGLSPRAVAIGDLNRDGKPDLAVTNSGTNEEHTVSVLLGIGDGSFGAKNDYGVGLRPASVAIADLDGDERPDLAVANGSNTVSVFLGNGDGTFGLKSDYGAGRGLTSVAIGDVSGDGMPDLVLATRQPSAVTVLLGKASVPTATVLYLFEALWLGERVEVRWEFGPTSDVLSSVVERGESERGPWTQVVSNQTHDGGIASLVDDGVQMGRQYYYRLSSHLSGGKTMTFGPISATGVAPARQFALETIAPNPSSGAVRIVFLMPRDARVRITVLDALGRCMAILVDGAYPAGSHQVVWDAVAGWTAAPAGLYFVRLESPQGASIRRVSLTR